MCVATENFNNAGQGYTTYDSISSNNRKWTNSIYGTSELGFIYKSPTSSGSDTTYYCDEQATVTNFLISGGLDYRYQISADGIFCLFGSTEDMIYGVTLNKFAGRLMYL